MGYVERPHNMVALDQIFRSYLVLNICFGYRDYSDFNGNALGGPSYSILPPSTYINL